MGRFTYTKADLENIVCCQLENLNAMHDLVGIMKTQNDMLRNANKKLKDEISEFREKYADYAVVRKRPARA